MFITTKTCPSKNKFGMKTTGEYQNQIGKERENFALHHVEVTATTSMKINKKILLLEKEYVSDRMCT